MVVLYNAKSNVVILIKKSFLNFIKKLQINNIPKKLLSELLKTDILVDSARDELAELKHRMTKGKFYSKILYLTIAPTLACNLNCTYCFEGKDVHNNKTILNKTNQKHLLNFLQKILKNSTYKKVAVTWYGGEPLLGIDIIFNLSKFLIRMCKENNISYSANVVTNGVLLNEVNAKKLKKCGVTHAQITLDGHEKIHDQRRIFSNGSGSFNMIFNNIINTVGILGAIHVRINLDEKNKDSVESLINAFSTKKLKQGILDFYIAPVIPNKNYPNYSLSCKEFSKYELKLNLSKDTITLPMIKSNYCYALTENRILMGPEGELYNCWEHFGDNSKIIGHISEPSSLTSLYYKFIAFMPTDTPKCRKCKFLPLCLGGCPNSVINGGKPRCETIKYNIKRKILSYLKYKDKNASIAIRKKLETSSVGG